MKTEKINLKDYEIISKSNIFIVDLAVTFTVRGQEKDFPEVLVQKVVVRNGKRQVLDEPNHKTPINEKETTILAEYLKDYQPLKTKIKQLLW